MEPPFKPYFEPWSLDIATKTDRGRCIVAEKPFYPGTRNIFQMSFLV
jgi:hypothetical protein